MADLKPLIRVRKHDIEQKQKTLSELYRQDEALENNIGTLETQLAIETEKSKNMDAEILRFFAPYSESVKIQVAAIMEDRKKLEVIISMAQDDMRDAFSDLKKIEIIAERRDAKERSYLDKKESLDLDEIAINGFMRSKND